MSITFTKSLKDLKSLYFHFLDGYLNPESGALLDTVKSMLDNYYITPKNDIKIIYYNYNGGSGFW